MKPAEDYYGLGGGIFEQVGQQLALGGRHLVLRPVLVTHGAARDLCQSEHRGQRRGGCDHRPSLQLRD